MRMLVPAFWVKSGRRLAVAVLVLASVLILITGCTLFQPTQRWNPEAPLSKLELAWDTTVAARQWAQQMLYAMWDRDRDRAVSAAERVGEFTDQALELLDEAFAGFERLYKREREAYDLLGEVADLSSKIILHFNTAPSLDWVWLIEQAKSVLNDLEEVDTKLEKAIEDRYGAVQRPKSNVNSLKEG